MNIKNCPNEAWEYEFIVARSVLNEYYYLGHYTNGFEAERKALQYNNGIVIHNVRIQGKHLKESNRKENK